MLEVQACGMPTSKNVARLKLTYDVPRTGAQGNAVALAAFNHSFF
jgi:hypothetical protein